MLNELLKRPIIPVIVIDDANDAEPLAEALLAGGMDVIEVTCRTAAAPEALARIKKAFPEMLLGAGTIVTRDQAQMCIDTGVSVSSAARHDQSVDEILRRTDRTLLLRDHRVNEGQGSDGFDEA